MIGIIVGCNIGIYASNSIASNIVLYSNDDSKVTNIKDALDELFVKANAKLLTDVVSVGDYVAYDAGTWEETKAKPTSQGEFGGYIAGQNKANNVSWCGHSDHSIYYTILKGWRVLSIDENTNTVILVHAGISECYYHGVDPNSSITLLNNHIASEYLNTEYATSAHNMTYSEAEAITGNTNATNNTLRKIGAFYWLGTTYDTSRLRCISYAGLFSCYNDNILWGIRPVVVLKPGIKTTGKTIDVVGNEAWSLVAP